VTIYFLIFSTPLVLLNLLKELCKPLKKEAGKSEKIKVIPSLSDNYNSGGGGGGGGGGESL
jgi:hypothetical protein